MTAFNPHEYLNSFSNYESKLQQLCPEDFTLHRIKKLLDLAGDPAKNLKVIHVAGTKGKGSSCAFLARILQEAGLRVGLYTSPHLHRVNERIRVLDKTNLTSPDPFYGSISDEELARVLNGLRPYTAAILNEGHVLTYFEVLTVAAISYFAGAGVEVVILETGLGGRLDATNAVDSLIAVITPISMDHVRILGDSLSQIASEKAGIIKNSHQQVILAPQDKEVMELLLEHCWEYGIDPFLVDETRIGDLELGLKGRHQRINAAAALEASAILKTMGLTISDEAQLAGLKNVRWPGRFELLGRAPYCIADGAHNEASARALAETLTQEHEGQRIIMVLGVSADKDITGVCRQLKERAGYFILTKADHPRAFGFKEKECIEMFDPLPFSIIDNSSQAFEKALKVAGPKDVIVVTGSLFITAEARAYWRDHVSI